MLWSKVSNTTLLIGILLVGAVLRFYQFFEIPFTHDEFSALFRTRFETLRELLLLGVKTTDTHPPGIQVFLWILTQWVGEVPWLLKLPFALMGVASIYFVFKLGQLWFNETVGLLAACVTSVSQYTIFYSQIARPYISGFFFCLLFAYSISKIAKSNTSKFPIGLGTLAVLSGGLAAYNHHFSLLTAVVMGLSLLFYMPLKFMGRYLLIGLLIAVLYLPNLPIFLHQLSLGGVESWLAKPQPRFIWDFVSYVFHYGTLPLIAILGIHLWLRIHKTDISTPLGPKIMVSSWFFIPYLVGYFYSVHVNAVLQYSVIIFGSVGWFLLLFSFLHQQPTWRNGVAIAVLVLAFLPSLIFGRQHYQLFYNSPYEKALADRFELSAEVPTWLHAQPHILNDFFEKGTPTFTFEWVDSLETPDMIAFLEAAREKYDTFYLAAFSTIPPNVIPLIQCYFPSVIQTNNYFNAATYVFGKGESSDSSRHQITSTNFEAGKLPLWDYTHSDALQQEGYYLMNGETAYALEFQMPIKLMAKHPNDFIDIVVKGNFLGGDASSFLVTAALEEGVSFWSSTSIADYIREDSTFVAIHSLKLSDIPIHGAFPVFKTRLWNHSGATVAIHKIEILRRSGNPLLYGYQGRITSGW